VTCDGSSVISGDDHHDVSYWLGAKDLRGSGEKDGMEGQGPAWSLDIGGKVRSVSVNRITGANVTLQQNGMTSLVVSSDTRIVYVDASSNMYIGTLVAIIDQTSKQVWPMDERSWFPDAESGTIKNGATVNLLFSYPKNTFKSAPPGTYNVYIIVRGIASDGTPFTQRIDCGSVNIS